MNLSKQQPRCQHCGFHPPTVYKYPLDDLDVSTLLKVWQAVLEQKENEINVANIGLSQTERLRMTQLRFHALVAKVKNDKGKQVGNMWLVTRRGAQFLKGEIKVPKHVYTQDNKVIDHSPETVSKQDFKVLDDFRPTYEIIEDKIVITPKVLQSSLL